MIYFSYLCLFSNKIILFTFNQRYFLCGSVRIKQNYNETNELFLITIFEFLYLHHLMLSIFICKANDSIKYKYSHFHFLKKEQRSMIQSFCAILIYLNK